MCQQVLSIVDVIWIVFQMIELTKSEAKGHGDLPHLCNCAIILFFKALKGKSDALKTLCELFSNGGKKHYLNVSLWKHLRMNSVGQLSYTLEERQWLWIKHLELKWSTEATLLDTSSLLIQLSFTASVFILTSQNCMFQNSGVWAYFLAIIC